MGIFKGGNPAISEKVFDKYQILEGDMMTVRGAMNKFGMMLLFLVAAAMFTWNIFYKQGPESIAPWMWGGLIVGMILAFIMIFKPTTSPYIALAYAICEGLFLGGISAMYDFVFAETYPSIIMHAVLLTAGTAVGMYALYSTGVIKVTNTFKRVVIFATLGIFIMYLVSIIMNLFGAQMPYLHDSSPIGIGISLVIVTVAALNLVLDFDMINKGAEQGAPKYMEWYGAFGLMVTIVWLYLEILRLLSKFASRD